MSTTIPTTTSGALATGGGGTASSAHIPTTTSGNLAGAAAATSSARIPTTTSGRINVTTIDALAIELPGPVTTAFTASSPNTQLDGTLPSGTTTAFTCKVHLKGILAVTTPGPVTTSFSGGIRQLRVVGPSPYVTAFAATWHKPGALTVVFPRAVTAFSGKQNQVASLAIRTPRPAATSFAAKVNYVESLALSFKIPITAFQAHHAPKGQLAITLMEPEVVLRGGTGASGSLGAIGPLAVVGLGGQIHVLTATQTVVINTKNFAHTTYTNYDFNSYATIEIAGVKTTFGAKAGGLYKLDQGTTDNNTAINWTLATGRQDFGDSSLKHIDAAYLTCGMSAGTLVVGASVDEGDEYDYDIPYYSRTETVQRKAVFGRGLRGKNWKIRVSDKGGETLTLDTIELNVKKTDRRI